MREPAVRDGDGGQVVEGVGEDGGGILIVRTEGLFLRGARAVGEEAVAEGRDERCDEYLPFHQPASTPVPWLSLTTIAAARKGTRMTGTKPSMLGSVDSTALLDVLGVIVMLVELVSACAVQQSRLLGLS